MKQSLEDILGRNTIRENVDLFPYLSMRLHTKAQYFFEAKSSDDLLHAIQAAHTLHLPFIMLGGGSNAVFQSAVVEGLVVKNWYSHIEIISEQEEEVDILIGSGTSMALLVQFSIEKGFSGLEYQKGLPGSIGGALFMNSKWTHPLSYVGDCVLSAVLANEQGTKRSVDKRYFAFAYDYSILQKTHELVLSVTFRLKKLNSQIVTSRAQKALEYRNKTQPSGMPTCGCFFRNISEGDQKIHNLPTKSAGYLIEQAGMKGKSIGSFTVSEVHANFIINTGGDARPEDLKLLTDLIKAKVKTQFGIQLEEEVVVL